jgi:hypothetical protein
MPAQTALHHCVILVAVIARERLPALLIDRYGKCVVARRLALAMDFDYALYVY